jgi:hypothetical protein
VRSGRLGLQKWLGFWLLQNYLDYLLFLTDFACFNATRMQKKNMFIYLLNTHK